MRRNTLYLWVALGAAVVALGMDAPPALADTTSFQATYGGTYSIVFGGCPNGDDHLQFAGKGQGEHVGQSTVSGTSCLRHDPLMPDCEIIDQDATAITAADGNLLRFVNQGEDCVHVSSTGTMTIQGTARYTIEGGTGQFVGSTGSGTVYVNAVVSAVAPTGVTGTFGPLAFSGTITSP